MHKVLYKSENFDATPVINKPELQYHLPLFTVWYVK